LQEEELLSLEILKNLADSKHIDCLIKKILDIPSKAKDRR